MPALYVVSVNRVLYYCISYYLSFAVCSSETESETKCLSEYEICNSTTDNCYTGMYLVLCLYFSVEVLQSAALLERYVW